MWFLLYQLGWELSFPEPEPSPWQTAVELYDQQQPLSLSSTEQIYREPPFLAKHEHGV